jgi:hypothetical protein
MVASRTAHVNGKSNGQDSPLAEAGSAIGPAARAA